VARVEPRPGGARPRPRTDAFLRGLARFVLGMLFREVELVGAERLPASGPVIVIANHSNSIVDGGILLGFLPRIPRFLAASTVWEYKPIAPFMTASGSVKVYRQQDGRAHEGSLKDSFTEAAALLADGGVLAIFPEGRTHDTPALLPFKTGTARIAQFTEARHGPLDLAVVPVGIDYEVKNLFRTRVCFTFGAPVRLGAGAAAGPAADPEADLRGDQGAEKRRDAGVLNRAMRAATGRLQRALSAVAPDFTNKGAARTITLAAEILAFEPGGRPGRPPAFSRIVTRRHAVEAALLGAEAGPEGTQANGAGADGARANGAGADGAEADGAGAARAALDAYAQVLAEASLADHEVAAPPDPAALMRSALALLPGLPVALTALVFCLPQALLLRAVSRSKPRDRQLTWITFGGLVVYPLTWLLWAIVLGLSAGIAFGAGWGWAVAGAVPVLAPVSAWLALPTLDRGWRIARALRARRLLRRDQGLGRSLTALRKRAATALGTVFGDGTG